MSELFQIPECKSPRLQWMEKHGVKTQHTDLGDFGDEDEITGERLYPWVAYTGEPRFPRPDAGYGDTEDEAIANLAKLKGWRLWNEAFV